MRDEQVRQPHALLQIVQEVDHLRLNRHIQRGDRLVADDELRFDGERAGNADALALAAGKLVREAVGVLAVEPDDREQLGHALLTALRVVHVVDNHALFDDRADGHARVERSVGILKDDLRLFGEGKAILLVG